MTLHSEFQMILQVDNLGLESAPPFAALAAECSDEEILSVHYLLDGCLEEALATHPKEPLTAGQQLRADELECQLRAYFRDPAESIRFRDLPLCHSVLPPHAQGGLPRNECEKVLEKVHHAIPCEEICTYGKVGEKVKWDDRQSIVSMYWEKAEGNEARALAIAVGEACSVSPFAVVVPCYRVVYAGPRLGHFGNNPYVECEIGEKQARKRGWEIKRWLLDREGWDAIEPAGNPRRQMSKWELRRRVGD